MVTAMGTVIRWIAIVSSVIVVLGFAAFAVDEIDKGSKNQQRALARDLSDLAAKNAAIGDPDPSPPEERAREAAHGPVRETIDDANDILLTPFAGLIDSDNAWVNRGVPSLLALLLYGAGLGTLANMWPKHRAQGGDWRTAS
jgi:hypothetical protein